MDQEQIVELLIRIDERTKGMEEKLDKVSNGTGFPRCAARGERIQDSEDRIEKLEGSQKWAWRTIGTALIAFVLEVIFNR